LLALYSYDASTSHRFCVRTRGSLEPYLFAEAATLENAGLIALPTVGPQEA
jgi:hypothetical protein